jgi:thymidine kinase
MSAIVNLAELDPQLISFAERGPSGVVSVDYDPAYAVRALLRDRELFYEEGVGFLESGGSAIVFAGPMASGKSALALAVGENLEEKGNSILYVKPSVDDRDATIKSRNGSQSSCCRSLEDCSDWELSNVDVLVLDEAQFSDPMRLLRLTYSRNKLGKRTVVSMLDEDFRGEHWQAYNLLVAQREKLNLKVIQTYALCDCCGEKAEKTQRLINGEPANYDDPVVVIGGNEAYKPACSKHHRVPGKLSQNDI